ncbi:MAG: hypothetical protein FJ279_20110 [Planctomycetes bacterium]|nr:hypothetical protein [Planctomycetota bacterium]MBM4084648.1 hypothetical protein [Planctomycetota bacterium]
MVLAVLVALAATFAGCRRPSTALSTEAQAAARRNLGKAPDLRKRFIAVAASAESLADASAVREALGGVLTAAARNDLSTAARELQAAEAALDRGDMPSSGRGEAAALALLREIEPVYALNEELMTEGHAAVRKLVGRASQHLKDKQFEQAARLLGLSASLMGLRPSAPGHPSERLVDASPPASADEAKAKSVVALCEATAAAESPGAAVAWLVDKARRELAAGRFAEAHWWASVALDALGLGDAAETADER